MARSFRCKLDDESSESVLACFVGNDRNQLVGRGHPYLANERQSIVGFDGLDSKPQIRRFHGIDSNRLRHRVKSNAFKRPTLESAIKVVAGRRQ